LPFFFVKFKNTKLKLTFQQVLDTCSKLLSVYISLMTKIIYNTHDNKTHTIDVQNGLTVMEGAVQNDIPGIDADCGGGMACATCHVYVDEDWVEKLPQKDDGEEDMLDMAFEPKKNSRLSCQIIVSDELDGLIINIPSKQS
tara:strand:- start:243 stop:665 length:423 start_codon:yes stop_codon:yes gene_type:complete